MAHTGPHATNDSAHAAMNMGTLRDVLLVRIASAGPAGVTRATLRSDIEPLVEHRLTHAEWRRSLDELVFIVLTEGLVVTHRMRLTATEAGLAAAASFLGAPIPSRADWPEVRDVLLVGRALGVELSQAMRRKKLENAQGLRGAILERSFGLAPAKTASVTGLRDTLARKAAANGGPNGSTRAKAPHAKSQRSRRAVERLLRRPREFASDAALLAELAAEQVGAQETSVPSLRKAILRKLVGKPGAMRAEGETSRPARAHVAPELRLQSAKASSPTTAAARDLAMARSGPAVPNMVGLDDFCREVVRHARACAEGWPGNRRAYIANVWQKLSQAQASWGLTQDAFKSRLVEAHKAGHLTLAYADLRSKDTIDLVQASVVGDRHNEWHFIRVDD